MSSRVKIAANGRPVRPFVMPGSVAGKLKVWRFLIYRRVTQVSVLLLFYGTAHWGWQIAGQPLLRGNLSASELLGVIPMADPFAVSQILLTGHLLHTDVLIGAALILVLYTLLGGRVWCSWVCPVNMITDLASWIRKAIPIRDVVNFRRGVRYLVLFMSLALSMLTGVAAFEWISPISIFHRELIFGIGMGWSALLGIFLFDLLVKKHGWCGHLCPLGAFYALLGRLAPLRIGFDGPTCTRCGECARVCPEPQVLHLAKAAEIGLIASGECTNCGRCITVCPEDTLKFEFRGSRRIRNYQQPEFHERRSV